MLTSFDFGSYLVFAFRSIHFNTDDSLVLAISLERVRMGLTVNWDARPFVLSNVDERFVNVSVSFDKMCA